MAAAPIWPSPLATASEGTVVKLGFTVTLIPDLITHLIITLSRYFRWFSSPPVTMSPSTPMGRTWGTTSWVSSSPCSSLGRQKKFCLTFVKLKRIKSRIEEESAETEWLTPIVPAVLNKFYYSSKYTYSFNTPFIFSQTYILQYSLNLTNAQNTNSEYLINTAKYRLTWCRYILSAFTVFFTSVIRACLDSGLVSRLLSLSRVYVSWLYRGTAEGKSLSSNPQSCLDPPTPVGKYLSRQKHNRIFSRAKSPIMPQGRLVVHSWFPESRPEVGTVMSGVDNINALVSLGYFFDNG